jgi:menaquinone-dependent protoporphyrinogen IX oxidase
MNDKLNGMIFTLSSRTKCLPICLKSLYKYYNHKYDYPVYVYYFDNIYSKAYIDNIHNTINNNIHFHQIDYGIPKNINKNELFMYRRNQYARSFSINKMGYLHMIHFFVNSYKYPGTHMHKYDYCFHFDDETLFKKEIPYDIFSKLNENNMLTGSLNCTYWPESGATQRHKDTTEFLFEFCNYYIKKYNIKRDTKQFKAFSDKKSFYSNNIRLTDSQVFTTKFLKSKEWQQWIMEVNNVGGIYKYRWGDHQLFAMFYAIHFDEEVFDYKLTKNTEYMDCGALRYIQAFAPGVKNTFQ